MGVVTVSSSASRASLGLSSRGTVHQTSSKGPFIVGFKTNKTKKSSLVSEPICIHSERKEKQKRGRSATKPPKGRVGVATIAEASPYTSDLDLNEAAAKLESLFKLSPVTENVDEQNMDSLVKQKRGRKSNITEVDEKMDKGRDAVVVRNKNRRPKRLNLDERNEMKKNKEMTTLAKKKAKEMTKSMELTKSKEMTKSVEMMKGEEEKARAPSTRKNEAANHEDEKIDDLLREYSASTDLVSLDWKKMKIPSVLPSSEHSWLFKLLEPRKALLQVKENLQRELGRDPTDAELGKATNMSVFQVRRHMEVGHAARNKLIKHNLRLVLFVMNKYFQDFTNGPKFQDLCQAGARGLITAIDRFEPRRKFRLSTYALFWIRHAIIRSMTVSNFTRIPFGLESVRVEIQKTKLELMFELKRMPTDEEVIERLGMSPERYQEVMRAGNSVASLHSRHPITQEELIDGITDVDGVDGDKRRQPALLRLALDDVLDSLKPKESLVIRQRYGLDGKGDRTLGEIAGNLNISREMVRKHEMKALMKLKHPARVDYLRRYVH